MTTLLLLLTFLSLALAFYALWRLVSLQHRFTAAFGASEDSADMESILSDSHKRIDELSRHLDHLDEGYRRLAIQASLASQKISIVRFNPFGDTGGDQSFVLAVLDAHNSGYVLTSIHGRGGTRVYVKPIDDGKSKYPLSEEEKQALSQASKRVPK